MLKQSVFTAILFCGLCIHIHHAVAMEPAAANTITLVTKEGTETKLDRDTALLLGTMRVVLEDNTDFSETQSTLHLPPISLSISKESLDTQLASLKHCLDVHYSDSETDTCTPKQLAQLAALSMEQRERKARIGSSDWDFNVSELPSIEHLAEQYRSANYLSIPENSELTARMIALTLLSPENLASLASKPSTPTDNTRPHIPAPLASQIHQINYPINRLYRSIPTEMAQSICNYVSPWITQWNIESTGAGASNGAAASKTCFSPDGKHVAFSHGRSAVICDAQNSEMVMEKNHSPTSNLRADYVSVGSLRFSSTGKFAIMAVWYHGISLFNIKDKTTRTTPIEFMVYDARISPDETKFIVRGDSDEVPIIAINTNGILHTIRHDNNNIATAFFAPQSGFIITQSRDSMTKITNPNTYQLLHKFEANVEINHPIQPFSADSTQLVYGSGKQAVVIDARTFAHQYSIDHETWVLGAEFSPDGSRIVIRGESGIITIFDTQKREPLNTFRYKVHAEAFGCSPDSRKILSRNDDIKMIDIQKGQELVSMYDSRCDNFTFSSDSKLIACTVTDMFNNDYLVKILDGNSGHIIDQIKQSQKANTLSFSSDSTKLAIATDTRFILAQKLPAETLEQHLLIRVLAHACEKDTLNDAWESLWVQKVLKTYKKDDDTEDTAALTKIKEAFKKYCSSNIKQQ